LKTTRDFAGTAAPSARLGNEGSRSSSRRFAAWIDRHFGQESGAHETGAAMVELAFVFALLVMLLVGTVTAAIAFGRNNSIENAAREASRYAATLPMNASWFTDVRDVARNAAMGELDSSVPGQYICVAHYDGGGGWSRLTDTGGVPSGGSVECFPDGLPADQPRVQIVTSRETNINVAIFSLDVTLTGEASARYER
jgi:hypothetical protein